MYLLVSALGFRGYCCLGPAWMLLSLAWEFLLPFWYFSAQGQLKSMGLLIHSELMLEVN
jgi:hypothetical protein